MTYQEVSRLTEIAKLSEQKNQSTQTQNKKWQAVFKAQDMLKNNGSEMFK